MSKITLSPDQILERDISKSKWTEIALDCKPANRPEAEKAMIDLYTLNKKPAPKFFWADSPVHARKMIFEMVGTNNANTYMRGQLDASLLERVTFLRSIGKVSDKNDLQIIDIYERLASSCGWIYPYEKGCVICEKPVSIVVDDFARPSNLEGPAIAFRDGEEIYAVDGDRVPKWVIMEPEKITKELISIEKNIEVKRVMILKFGRSKYLIETGAKVIDVDYVENGGGSFCTVMRVLLEDDEGDRVLMTHDGGTKRIYDLNVSRDASNCTEAHESMSGLDDKNIKVNC